MPGLRSGEAFVQGSGISPSGMGRQDSTRRFRKEGGHYQAFSDSSSFYLFAASVDAIAPENTYQVRELVLEMRDDAIVIQKRDKSGSLPLTGIRRSPAILGGAATNDHSVPAQSRKH
jgi:hypothetical protein